MMQYILNRKIVSSINLQYVLELFAWLVFKHDLLQVWNVMGEGVPFYIILRLVATVVDSFYPNIKHTSK